MENDLSDHRWLVGAEAESLLAEVAGAEATPALVARLRKATTPSRAALVLELAELRQRAAAKFRHAGRMFFSRKGYEQATDEWIARHKAQRFTAAGSVRDLCCGVGGDLVGLAGAGVEAVGVERDPVVALYAERNAAPYGGGVRVERGEAGPEAVDGADAWHADPDRRPAGRRTSQPDAHEPSLATLEEWRRRTPAGAVKLAPAARLPEAWLAECELEWISRGGECRQLVAWSGGLALSPGQRRATRVLAGPQNPQAGAVSVVGVPGVTVDPAPRLAAFVYDLDPAVLAAGLDGAVAQAHGLAPFTVGAAYLTGDGAVADPLLQGFEVVEAMPLDRKRLAGWLAERGVGRLEIKARGVDLRPERLRAELKPRGDRAITLLVCPAPGERRGKPMVIAAERIEGDTVRV